MCSKHIIFADSRGRYLHEAVATIKTILINPSAYTSTLVLDYFAQPEKLILIYCPTRPIRYRAYIMGGVNDITARSKNHRRKFTFQHESVESLTTHLNTLLQRSDRLLRDHIPNSIILFCPLIGLHLATSIGDRSQEHQTIVNEAVVNESYSVDCITCSPLTAWQIHTSLPSSARRPSSRRCPPQPVGQDLYQICDQNTCPC